MNVPGVSSLSIWDVKKYVDKVKNIVMNYTEMEIKVNDATGTEPWGASRTLMLEIAEATHSSKEFEEIMNMIYTKLAKEGTFTWRQVYKTLQLLEYLVKNGSDKVVNNVKKNESILKALRHFEHIDEDGTDRGINVKVLSKEILELINDTPRLKEERKTAKANRKKYTGVGSGTTGSFNTSSGFGSSSRQPDGSSINLNRISRQEKLPSSSRSKLTNSRKVSFEKESKETNNYQKSKHNKEIISQDDEDGDLLGFSTAEAKPSTFKTQTKPNDDGLTFGEFISSDNNINSSTNGNLIDSDWGDFQSVSYDNFAPQPPQLNINTSNPPANKQKSGPSDLLTGMDIDLLNSSFQIGTSLSDKPAAVSPVATGPINVISATNSPALVHKKNDEAASPVSANQQPESQSDDIWGAHKSLFTLDNLTTQYKHF